MKANQKIKKGCDVQILYDFAVAKKDVHTTSLRLSAQEVYDAVKDWGIKNIAFYYKDTQGNNVVISGDQSPEVMRAVVIRVMQQHYRMTDSKSGRMETHFGLELLAKEYLKIRNADETECLSLNEFKYQYLGKRV